MKKSQNSLFYENPGFSQQNGHKLTLRRCESIFNKQFILFSSDKLALTEFYTVLTENKRSLSERILPYLTLTLKIANIESFITVSKSKKTPLRQKFGQKSLIQTNCTKLPSKFNDPLFGITTVV